MRSALKRARQRGSSDAADAKAVQQLLGWSGAHRMVQFHAFANYQDGELERSLQAPTSSLTAFAAIRATSA
jgi:hypothetical protein